MSPHVRASEKLWSGRSYIFLVFSLVVNPMAGSPSSAAALLHGLAELSGISKLGRSLPRSQKTFSEELSRVSPVELVSTHPPTFIPSRSYLTCLHFLNLKSNQFVTPIRMVSSRSCVGLVDAFCRHGLSQCQKR